MQFYFDTSDKNYYPDKIKVSLFFNNLIYTLDKQ